MKPIDVKIGVDDDTKDLFDRYANMEKQKFMAQKAAATEDEDKLCFRVCTSSGTRINIPPEILKDFLIAGGILAGAKIIIDVVSVISKFKNN